MSSLLSAELAATCNALGYFDTKTNKYYADGNTLETVKDLIRYLRRDDDSRDIRRQLGETKVLQTDLLPLLTSYWEETDLFDVLLRLIVNLTTPALMIWNEEVPAEKTTRNHYIQVEEHLQSYKEAFADENVWAVLSTRLSKILEIDYTERGDENSLIIERILILIRNVLYVPADPIAEKRTDNDASVHDQVLWALHQSGMLDIILYMTSSTNEQAYYMHLLEILSYMLREQKASELASAALQRSQTEKLRDEAELLSIRNKETNQKRKQAKAYTGTRHSRFGGTYVVKAMKSISDNELIYHKPLKKLDGLSFDLDKKKPKTPKNRLPMQETTVERKSAFSIRLFLKEFCVEFLNGSYNTMMYHVKDNLSRAKAQAHDESYYLWAIRFFMEFNRCYKFEVKLVSETMSVQTFHYVQQQSENYYDLMSTDKKKFRLWSRRLHLALLAYRELFSTLCAMDRSDDHAVRNSSKVIKSNIFYVMEYREFILTLLVNYDELKMSDVYLKDLLETQHLFLKMLETFAGKEGTVLVQKKSRKKKKTKSSAQLKSRSGPTELDLDGMWDEASPQLSTILEGVLELAEPVVPFDAASDVPIDDQKPDAMKNIQRKLRSGDYESAIGLLRAAREVWPENDSFGSDNMAPEEEFLALRDIFFADLGENTVAPTEDQAPDTEEEDDEDDEEEEEQRVETDFKLADFINRLANPKIIRACGLALRNFDKNSVNTNHCIVKLLHRIAFDCKMYVMVFQVSIFRTFQKIYSMKDFPEYKELVKFATYILRQFFRIAKENDRVYLESLFWKRPNNAYEIEHGEGSYKENNATAARAWSEYEEDELRRLFMEHQKENYQEDVVDWITANRIDTTKTRKQVLRKLKELHLIVDKNSRKSSGPAKSQNWGAQEETQLRELFEHFQDAIDPLTCIIDRLTVKRPKNRIIEKLLVMGLIQDKSEMRKKRAPKTKSGKKSKGNAEELEFINSGSDSSQPQTSPQNLSTKKRKTKTKTQKIKKITRPQLIKQLIHITTLDMSEPLEWLNESLTDAIEDYGTGDNEGIPLVPISDYAMTAMENPDFQNLLRALGIDEPSSEQEAYWRIPSHLTRNALQDYSDLVKQALDNTLTIPEENEEPEIKDSSSDEESEVEEQEVNNSSSDDEDLFDKIKKQVQENKLKERIKESAKKQKITQIVNEANMEQSEPGPSQVQKSRKRKIANVDDSEDSNDVPETTEAADNESMNKEGNTMVNRKRLRRITESGDESDVTIKNSLNESDNETNENYSIRKRSILNSDDEENMDESQTKIDQNKSDPSQAKKAKRKKIAVVEDSEDSNDVPENIEASNSENRINEEYNSQVNEKSTRRIAESDDEDEASTQNSMSDNKTSPLRKTRILDSDDEESVDKENLNTMNVTETDNKRTRSLSNSDSEKANKKRKTIIDSDDE